MGEYVRKLSTGRLKMPSSARDTLMPCVACEGSGTRVVETDTAYRQMPCRWCEGAGVWTELAAKMFVRWLAIAAHARKAGYPYKVK